MQSATSRATLIIGLALCVHPALAAEKQADVPPTTKAGQPAKPDAKPKRAPQLVELNSASKAELKKLPGIGDAEAEKIVAGRPYGSKSHLVTRGIISRATYEDLKTRIMVKPKI